MEKQIVLVVGGAGFIGSHMLKMLAQSGYHTVCLDNLSTGYRNAVHYGELVIGDLADINCLEQLFTKYNFSGVIHFASYIRVEESVSNPAKYYQNNLHNTLNLLNTMVHHNVSSFIFSSTAAIYGDPKYSPIDEIHPKLPINPYGRSKWMVEQILEDYDHAYGLKSVRLRYFNAAGADPNGKLSERHIPETHLIPLVLQAASGQRPNIKVFGQDYDTPDGTCIRDYIHVDDLCMAHLLALKKIWSTQQSHAYNLGNGTGFSVLDVIDEARKVTGRKFPVIMAKRRPGDPSILVADSSLAKRELNWQPKYFTLKDMMTHAWNVLGRIEN
ncbi:MAG: UDP-glucose 4-epimerase GalE [Magnetococcales bacterium]|nr:UDP-glucose 4-epimerase GalE [Magnetococcales bacterium]